MGAWCGILALAMGLMGEFVPLLGGVGVLASLMIVIAMFRAAAESKRQEMRNALIIYLVLSALSVLAFAILSGAAYLDLLKQGEVPKDPEALRPLLPGALAAWFLFCAAAWYWWRALRELAQASGVALFAATGQVYFIGALLTMVLVGFFIMLAAQLMQIRAFLKVVPDGGLRPPPLPPAAPPRSGGGWGPPP